MPYPPPTQPVVQPKGGQRAASGGPQVLLVDRYEREGPLFLRFFYAEVITFVYDSRAHGF